MDKKEILDILDNAKDERGAVPMRLVRQAFDKLPTIQPEKTQPSREGATKDATSELIERQQAIDAVMEYGAIWMEYSDAMDKDEIAQAALNNAKSTMIRILKELPSVQPERAIPLSWIENEIKWLKSLDNTFSEITALQISAMVNKWRDEQNETD